MAKAVFAVAIEYDENKTDPEALATALDKVLELGIRESEMEEDYGWVKPLGDGFQPVPLNPDHILRLEWTRHVKDDAYPNKPGLAMRARQDAYGITVEAVSDHGEVIGSITLDFHDNILSCLVFHHGSEEPDVNHKLSLDVNTLRKTKPEGV